MTAQPNTVVLDGVMYAVDLADYRFGPLDTFRDSVTQADQTTDALFNARGAWARYQTSWHHGAGQEIRDFLDDSDPYRFEQSIGFNPWGKLGLQLAGQGLEGDDWSFGSNPFLQRSSTYLFLADGADLFRATSGPMALSTMGAGDMTGTIQSMTSDGSDLYIATSAGVFKLIGSDTTPDAFSTPVTGNWTKVAFVANRLLGGKANELYEIAGAGTIGTAIIDHYQDAFRWTTIFSVGSRIYVGGYAGAKSELYTLTVDSGGGLVQGVEAAAFPLGEQLLCALSVGGSVLLGTSSGIRFAQVGADGTLTYGKLISAPGKVNSICAEGNFAWATWNDSTTLLSGDSGLIRLDLSTFVDTLQPAYACDVVFTGVAEVKSVERYNGWTVVTADDLDDVMYITDENLLEQGLRLASDAKITSGRVYFGTIVTKGLVEANVGFTPLIDGMSLTVSVYDESGDLMGDATTSTIGATSLSVTLDGSRVLWCTVEITYEWTLAGYTTEQLVIHSWNIRGYPAPPQSLQWQVPIITHQRAEMGDGEGQTLVQTPRGVITNIEALHRTRELVSYTEGDLTYEVRVENFSHVARMWSDDGSAPVGICLVQLVGSAT